MEYIQSMRELNNVAPSEASPPFLPPSLVKFGKPTIMPFLKV